jgi:hypothetical protein
MRPDGKGRPPVGNREDGPDEHFTSRSLTASTGSPPDSGPCVTCGHDPAAYLQRRLDDAVTAWQAGHRAGRERADELRLGAFADGWHMGLQAGAERSTA